MEHHKTLGVPPDATIEQIKHAYKKHALELHPDRNKKGAEAFIAVTQAYRELMMVKLGRKTSAASPAPKAAPKKAHHDMSFVKGKISRSMVWAPDYQHLRKPQPQIENLPCDSCSGTGKILSIPGMSIVCPQCHGLGIRTKIFS